MFATVSDTPYRYSGSSTNWSLSGSADSRPESAEPDGDLAVKGLDRQLDRCHVGPEELEFLKCVNFS